MGKCCSCDCYHCYQKCLEKITWPATIAVVHVLIYLLALVFNTVKLVEFSIIAYMARTGMHYDGWLISSEIELLSGGGSSGPGESDEDELESGEDVEIRVSSVTSNHFGFAIIHFVVVILLALVGLLVSVNLLKSNQEHETLKNLKIWLVYTASFCILVIPYYVWRLSTSEHIGRWLLQLVLTNALEGYFLGTAYGIIIEIQSGGIETAVKRTSSRFKPLHSRDSQITFVCDVTNLRTFSEIKI